MLAIIINNLLYHVLLYRHFLFLHVIDLHSALVNGRWRAEITAVMRNLRLNHAGE